MRYKRVFVRVPLAGEAILTNNNNPVIKARTIDISHGGVAIAGLAEELATVEYRIEILTEKGQRIQLAARLVRTDDTVAGFRTLNIDQESQEIIKHLVFDYQTTPDFLKQLDEFNLLDQRIVDEEGNEIEISFENDAG